MFIEKKQGLKRFTYACLSFTSIMISTEIQAIENLSEEDMVESVNGRYLIVPQSKKDKGGDSEEHRIIQKNNFIGVALFSGSDPVSYAIKGLTYSKISHVGIILADAQDENLWYCLESTGSVGEVLRGQYPHVRITPWDFVINEYDGNVSYRLAIFEDKDRPDSKRVGDFVKKNNNKSYTRNPLKLIKALLRKNSETESKPSKTFFCSELAAEILMELDILNKGIAGNYLPKDFSSKGSIKLNSGVTLTPEFVKNKTLEN